MATINGTANSDVLTGTSANDIINGYAGNDVLNGKAGADALKGGLGNDRYIVDNIGDKITELDGQGTDVVESSVTFSVAGQYIENLKLTGNAAINGTGNILANTLIGNSAANKLNGGAGADTMKGGLGNDIYVVDNIGDKVTELSGQGTDTVQSSVSFSLAGQYIETLKLTGSAAINASGNGFANTLIGNSGANRLNGGAGADIMKGGSGNDIYVVDNAGDKVTELSGQGTDVVESSVTFSLAGQHIETLKLTGSAAITGTGNGLVNTLIGNSAANILDGGGGADTLTGGGGADTFAFTTALSGGIDRITDFQASADRVQLGGSAGQPFAALASGALGAAAFRIGSAAADSDDRIVYNSATGALLYDADGNGGGGAVHFATLSTGLALTASHFTVSGPANQLSSITSGATASVTENSAASTVVYTATAVDSDGDKLVFALGGEHADRLTIDAATGQVRLKTSGDFETQSIYNFTVTATDSSGQGGSKSVTLTVTDVSESAGAYVVAEQEANNSFGAAQTLNRNLFTVSTNANVPDDSLPTAIIQGKVATGSDKDFFSITLKEGELLILDVDGTTNGLDALLRVFGPGGAELTLNDDPGFLDPGSKNSTYGHNTDSQINFRAPSGGTYTFSVASFVADDGTATSGAYTLNVSIGPPASAAQIHEENIQALVSGSSWSTSNVTYGFTTSASQYGSNEGVDEKGNGFQTLSTVQRQVARTSLSLAANATNLVFTEQTSSPGSAMMRYAMSDTPDTAHAYYPGSGDGGDSWYNNNGPTIDGEKRPPQYDSPRAGNYAYITFLHETGHALGLKHGHETPPLNFAQDSMEYSIMTYRSYVGASLEGGYGNESWGYAQTFMMYDIAALQRMYGADFTTNSGATVYTWNNSTGAFMINGATQWTPGGNRVFMTIWDGGGNDTYDLSNYSTGVTIDLRPGEWTKTSSVQLANLGDFHMARGNVANALLYENDVRSLIENAVGGAGNDTLIANQAMNRLTGGGGADRFDYNSVADSGRGALADILTDFVSGSDRIDLSGIDANSNAGGDQAFAFIGTGAFTGVAGQLRYQAEGSGVRIFADLNGDKVADFELVANSATIVATDFIV